MDMHEHVSRILLDRCEVPIVAVPLADPVIVAQGMSNRDTYVYVAPTQPTYAPAAMGNFMLKVLDALREPLYEYKKGYKFGGNFVEFGEVEAHFTHYVSLAELKRDGVSVQGGYALDRDYVHRLSSRVYVRTVPDARLLRRKCFGDMSSLVQLHLGWLERRRANRYLH